MNPIQRGHEAQVILTHPLVEEAFNTIEDALRETWEASTDPSVREELWHTLKGAKRFKQVFTNQIENGEYELTLQEKNNAE